MTVQDMNCEDLVPLYNIANDMGMEFATATLHNSFYFRKTDNKIDDKYKVAQNVFYQPLHDIHLVGMITRGYIQELHINLFSFKLYLPPFRNLCLITHHPGTQIYLFPPFLKLRKLICDFRPDVVILRERSAYSMAAYLICRKKGYPCILYNQNPLCLPPSSSSTTCSSSRWCLRGSYFPIQRICTVSDAK